jgi:tRNA pseudouridine55 synthase
VGTLVSALCGILNIAKPGGITSRATVNRVQRLVRPAKVGHAGTLDPLATGVLVVCVGRATRLIPFVQQPPKVYRARFRLGSRSDTDDITGEVIPSEFDGEVSREDVVSLLPQFQGRIEQVPPAYSAVRVKGRRAYALARKGTAVELTSRPVDVYEISLNEFAYPDLAMTIECGSGTYIRSIGRDLGDLLGCGAVMTALERTCVGPFELENAVSLDTLSDIDRDDVDAVRALLQPAAMAIGHLPSAVSTDGDVQALANGLVISAPVSLEYQESKPVAVMSESGELACIARYMAAEGQLAPKHVFVDPKPIRRDEK